MLHPSPGHTWWSPRPSASAGAELGSPQGRRHLLSLRKRSMLDVLGPPGPGKFHVHPSHLLQGCRPSRRSRLPSWHVRSLPASAFHRWQRRSSGASHPYGPSQPGARPACLAALQALSAFKIQERPTNLLVPSKASFSSKIFSTTCVSVAAGAPERPGE